jgi:hypothetical protein
MTDWKGPVERIYSVKIKWLGLEPVRVRYMISYYYGGKDGNGRGRYITNFVVKTLSYDSNLLLGQRLDMKVVFSNPMPDSRAAAAGPERGIDEGNPKNIGTAKDPVAYLEANLLWTLTTRLTQKSETWTYALTGTGEFKNITEEDRNRTGAINPVLEKIKDPSPKPAVVEPSWR